MARKGEVFNRFARPRLLRKRISSIETMVGALLILIIFAMAAWLVDQRDRYDPAERDIDIALLEAQSVEDTLYKTSLKRWRDPELEMASSTAVSLGPFDSSLLAGGWRSSGNPQIFDRENLFEKINGQAEQYLKFGFEELMVLSLEHPARGRFLDVFLYDQGTFEGSLGVYQELRGDRPVQQRGSVQYTSNPLGAMGISGSLHFQITADAADAAVEEMTARVLATLSKRDVADALPAGYSFLHLTMGIPFDGIAYQPTNVFQYRFASEFWFASIKDAEDARIFIHAAPSEGEARELYQRLHRELLEDYESIQSADHSVLLRHRFLETHFGLLQEGTRVFGFERHPDGVAAVQLLESLPAILTGAEVREQTDADGEAQEGYHVGEEREYR